MVRLFWFARTEIFQNKRNVLKGSPTKFPNGISERKMCLPFASSRPYANFYLRHVGCVNMAAAESAVFLRGLHLYVAANS